MWHNRQADPAGDQFIKEGLALHFLDDLRLEAQLCAAGKDDVLDPGALIARAHHEGVFTKL